MNNVLGGHRVKSSSLPRLQTGLAECEYLDSVLDLVLDWRADVEDREGSHNELRLSTTGRVLRWWRSCYRTKQWLWWRLRKCEISTLRSQSGGAQVDEGRHGASSSHGPAPALRRRERLERLERLEVVSLYSSLVTELEASGQL